MPFVIIVDDLTVLYFSLFAFSAWSFILFSRGIVLGIDYDLCDVSSLNRACHVFGFLITDE